MPSLNLNDAVVYIGEQDMSGISNQLALTADITQNDATVFGNDTVANRPGLTSAALELNGFWDTLFDKRNFDKIGGTDELISIAAEGASLGDVGYIFLANEASYNPGAPIGELFATTINAVSSDTLRRGTVMERGAFTVTVEGTNRELGNVASGQKLYAALHVIAVAGTNPTLDINIESDTDGVFATPTTRISMTQVTDATGPEGDGPVAELKSVAGAISDTFFRADFTIGGTDNPSFTILLILAIA